MHVLPKERDRDVDHRPTDYSATVHVTRAAPDGASEIGDSPPSTYTSNYSHDDQDTPTPKSGTFHFSDKVVGTRFHLINTGNRR